MLRNRILKIAKEKRENTECPREEDCVIFLISNRIGLKSIYMPHLQTTT